MRLSCNYTVDIDECISNPCSKNDPCNDSIDGRGYFAILDIDECISNPCSNNATCSDSVNGYVCICDLDFNGTHCEHGMESNWN